MWKKVREGVQEKARSGPQGHVDGGDVAPSEKVDGAEAGGKEGGRCRRRKKMRLSSWRPGGGKADIGRKRGDRGGSD